MLLKIFVSLLLITSPNAFSQTLRSHPATSVEYEGYWRLHKIDNKYQPADMQVTPMFQGECQFFVHERGGRWDQVELANMGGAEKTLELCDKKTPTEVTELRSFSAPQQLYTWSPIKISGFFLTERENPKQAFLWKADVVEEDFDATKFLGIHLKAKDLIAQLWNADKKRPAWFLILRPMKSTGAN